MSDVAAHGGTSSPAPGTSRGSCVATHPPHATRRNTRPPQQTHNYLHFYFPTLHYKYDAMKRFRF